MCKVCIAILFVRVCVVKLDLAMSDAMVKSLYTYAKKNQPIPPWVQNLPANERAEKIAMIEKYGSPNVFSQFQPHITIAYDTKDNVTQIYSQFNGGKAIESYKVSEVQISKVGPHGTVLKGQSVANITLSEFVRMRKLEEARRMNEKKHVTQKKRSHHHSPVKSGDNSWDYFLLVSEWPGSVTPGPVPSYIDTFTLHGLWPNRDDNSYPSFCNDSYPFRYSEIADIIQDLDAAWYDTLHDQANASSFWGHEWEKHGTCAMSDSQCCNNERAYFQTAINLHGTFDYADILSGAGITPSSQTTYPKDDVLSALSAKLSYEPLIRCQNQDGSNNIYNLAVCLDKTLNQIECPDDLEKQWQNEENCDDQIGFPEIPH